MTALALAAAAVAAPPEGVDLEDLIRFEQGRDDLLTGPPGCWVVGGKLAITLAGFSAPTRMGRGERRDHHLVGTFEGMLADGAWKNLSYTLSPEDSPSEPSDLDLPVLPTVGKLERSVLHRTNPHPDQGGWSVTSEEEGFNVVRGALEHLASTGGSTAYAEWSDPDASVVLFQDVPTSDNGDVVTVRTLFPGGGPATALDAVFPRRIRRSQGIWRFSLYDLNIHLRARRGRVVPRARQRVVRVLHPRLHVRLRAGARLRACHPLHQGRGRAVSV